MKRQNQKGSQDYELNSNPKPSGGEGVSVSPPAETGPESPGSSTDIGAAIEADIWPGEKARQNRKRKHKGLPEHKNLLKLARCYVKEQRALWPDLASSGMLPELDDQKVEELAVDFESCFIEDSIPDPSGLSDGQDFVLGASYLRYSSDQQNPRSLDDQLALQLRLAQREKVFIPWQYVFADAGVSGQVGDRTGYRLAKESIRRPEIQALCVDELARATRDMVEAVQLLRLAQSTGTRLRGASDGTDSNSAMANMTVAMSAVLNEQFVEQHRYRVKRGKYGAAERGTVTGRPPLGIKIVTRRDDDGNPVLGRQDRPVRTYATDEQWAWVPKWLAELFVDRKWSTSRIAKEFNRQAVGDKQTWHASNLTKMLRNRLYIGIMVYRKTKHENDPVTGKLKIVKNPDGPIVTRLRHIKIWSWRRWKQIQARLKEIEKASPKAKGGRKKGAKNKVHPTTTISGVLYCGYCGRELKLYGSHGPRKQFACLAGRNRQYGCQLSSSKSIRIIQPVLLDYVLRHVLTEERLDEFVTRANEYIEREKNRPQPDTSGLEASLASAQARRDRLADLVEEGGASDLSVITQRIRKYEKEIAELKRSIAEVRDADMADVPPLNREDILRMLDDLRDLFQQESASVGTALQRLLGEVYVQQHRHEDGDRWVWVAKVKSDLLPLTAEAAQNAGCPFSYTLMKLSEQKWTGATSEETLHFYHRYKYELYGEQAVRLLKQGMKGPEIAVKLGVHLATIGQAIRFYRTGCRPRWANRGSQRKGDRPLYQEYAEQVQELLGQGCTQQEVAEKLHISLGTVFDAKVWKEKGLRPADRYGTKDGKYYFQRIAPKVAELVEGGMRFHDVARKLSLEIKTVAVAYEYATGNKCRPEEKPPGQDQTEASELQTKVEQIAAEFHRLRDQGMTFEEIADHFEASKATVRRARLLVDGEPPCRPELAARIVKMAEEGMRIDDITMALGIKIQTVTKAYEWATGEEFRAKDEVRMRLDPAMLPNSKAGEVAAVYMDLRDEGLTYQEIADRFGVSTATVRRARLLAKEATGQ